MNLYSSLFLFLCLNLNLFWASSPSPGRGFLNFGNLRKEGLLLQIRELGFPVEE